MTCKYCLMLGHRKFIIKQQNSYRIWRWGSTNSWKTYHTGCLNVSSQTFSNFWNQIPAAASAAWSLQVSSSCTLNYPNIVNVFFPVFADVPIDANIKRCSTMLRLNIPQTPRVSVCAWQRWVFWSRRCLHVLFNPSHVQGYPYVPLTSELIPPRFAQQHSPKPGLNLWPRAFKCTHHKSKARRLTNELCAAWAGRPTLQNSWSNTTSRSTSWTHIIFIPESALTFLAGIQKGQRESAVFCCLTG